MAYDTLKSAIAAVIKTNGNKEITGDLLQQALFAMINSLGADYQFAGVALQDTNPGTPDQNVFYLAGPGTYTNFGGYVVDIGCVAVFSYNGSWNYSTMYIQDGKKSLDIPMTIGGFINTSGGGDGTTTFSHSQKIPVQEGDEIVVTGWAGNASVANIAGYNSAGNFVSALLAGANNFWMQKRVTIPSGISYIVVSLGNSTHGNYKTITGAGISVPYLRLAEAIKAVPALLNDVERLTNIVGEIKYLNRESDLKDSAELGFANFQGAIAVFSDDYFSVDCASRNGQFPGLQNNLLGSQLAAAGEPITIEFWAKLSSGSTFNPLWLYLSGTNRIGYTLTNSWQKFSYYISRSVVSTIDRIQFSFAFEQYDPTPEICGFDIKDFTITIPDSIAARVNELESRYPSLSGKKIAVIGDSISTIFNKNNPYWTVKSIDVGQQIQSYVTWWDVWANDAGTTPTGKTIGGVSLTAAMIGTKQTFTPVAGDVGKQIGVSSNYNGSGTIVWSEKLCDITGAILLANASWSGSRICSGQTGTYELSEAWNDYTIGCCKVRDDDGNDVVPDIIIVYRGTNDFSHGPISRINDVPLNNGIPATDYIDGLYEYRAGYYKTIQKLRTAYPKAYIVCCTLNVFKRNIYDVFPTRNGYYTLPEMNEVIRDIANTMGCGLIEFDKDGITFENCYDGGYITDSETTPTHPNSKGHAVMAERALVDLKYYLQQ